MTPTRLRQIADQLESVCIEKRSIKEKVYISCSSCRKSAEELREFAKRGWSEAPQTGRGNDRARRVSV